MGSLIYKIPDFNTLDYNNFPVGLYVSAEDLVYNDGHGFIVLYYGAKDLFYPDYYNKIPFYGEESKGRDEETVKAKEVGDAEDSSRISENFLLKILAVSKDPSLIKEI